MKTFFIADPHFRHNIAPLHTQIRNSTTDFLVFTKQNSEDGIEVRVNSIRATQFRQWATKVLRTYTIQGYLTALEKSELTLDSILKKY